MSRLSATAMLAAWERGQSGAPGLRALELLDAAGVPGDVPVGERDARLLELWADTFGDALSAVADCPACGERLDVSLSSAALRAAFAGRGGPSAADVADAAATGSVEAGRSLLLERCGAIEGSLGAALAEIGVACPCGFEWEMGFDIVPFLWAEVDAAARELLRDVHVLASAYGWREDDVLALSPGRRAAYLEMAGG